MRSMDPEHWHSHGCIGAEGFGFAKLSPGLHLLLMTWQHRGCWW